jgi:hypothetical protein
MSSILATVLAVAMVVVAPASAQAITWFNKDCVGFSACDAQGKGNAGYAAVYTQSFWSMYGGHNCVNYVAYRLQTNGVPKFTITGQGNAYQSECMSTTGENHE